MTMRVVHLSVPPKVDGPAILEVVIIAGKPAAAAEYWLDRVTFTSNKGPCTDRRVVTVDPVSDTVADVALAWGLVDAVG